MKRRDLVAGFGLGAAAHFLAPICRDLVREAVAQEGPPSRFLLFLDNQGWEEWRYSPVGGANLTAGLHSSMEALTPYAPRMQILDQFYNRFNVGLHGNGRATLTMRPSPMVDPNAVDSGPKFGPAQGVSIDRLIGSALQGSAPFPSLNFSIQGSIPSADGPNEAVPSYRNPFAAYAELFGDRAGDDAEAAQRRLLQRQKSLDLAVDDVKRLQTRLAGPEREKLEQYLASLEALDTRLSALAAAQLACEAPPPISSEFDREHKKYAAIDLGLVDALVALAQTSLLCGQTRTVGIRLTPARGNYDHLGVDDDKHNTQHASFSDQGTDTNRRAEEALVAIDRWHTETMAGMLASLDGTAEGEGTVLDQTLVMWLNEGGGQHHTNSRGEGGVDRYPALLIGDPRGAFQQLGRYIRFPRNEHSVADLFTAVARALGLDIESFGEPGVNRGPLPGV
ncbi:MAG: DUF1552 domain-containing protein [Myxococcota bacterium]